MDGKLAAASGRFKWKSGEGGREASIRQEMGSSRWEQMMGPSRFPRERQGL